MTVLKTKINGLWTEIAGDVSPIAQVPQNVIDFVAFNTPTAWTAPTFLNNWINFGGNYQACQYRKVGDTVEIRGMIKSGTLNQSCFLLPATYRPLQYMHFAVPSNDAFGVVRIQNDGNVYPYGGNILWFALDTIRFSTI